MPAVVIPIQWTKKGLPVAVQVVAREGEDELALSVAAQLETNTTVERAAVTAAPSVYPARPMVAAQEIQPAAFHNVNAGHGIRLAPASQAAVGRSTGIRAKDSASSTIASTSSIGSARSTRLVHEKERRGGVPA